MPISFARRPFLTKAVDRLHVQITSYRDREVVHITSPIPDISCVYREQDLATLLPDDVEGLCMEIAGHRTRQWLLRTGYPHDPVRFRMFATVIQVSRAGGGVGTRARYNLVWALTDFGPDAVPPPIRGRP